MDKSHKTTINIVSLTFMCKKTRITNSRKIIGFPYLKTGS